MKRLLTIYRQPNLNLDTSHKMKRTAYRAIIFNQDRLLVIQSQKYGEIKFPGGGKEPNESAFDVLKREVLEETGYRIKRAIVPFGSTLEYSEDHFTDYELFIQDSRYYLCDIYPEAVEPNYFDYEIDYGYYPKWVTLEEAIKTNETIIKNDKIPWLERDTLVMKLLADLRDNHAD